MKAEEYDKLKHDSITKSYKKSNTNDEKNVLQTDKNIAHNFNIYYRMERQPKSESFITLKDHKDYFKKTPSCRLLDPNKGETGRVSKKILSKINGKLREKLAVNQWTNTKQVIDWLKHIQNKNKMSFIQFDIVEFYPSITYELLHSYN